MLDFQYVLKVSSPSSPTPAIPSTIRQESTHSGGEFEIYFQILGSSTFYNVALTKLLDPSKPRFPHLKMRLILVPTSRSFCKD